MRSTGLMCCLIVLFRDIMCRWSAALRSAFKGNSLLHVIVSHIWQPYKRVTADVWSTGLLVSINNIFLKITWFQSAPDLACWSGEAMKGIQSTSTVEMITAITEMKICSISCESEYQESCWVSVDLLDLSNIIGCLLTEILTLSIAVRNNKKGG